MLPAVVPLQSPFVRPASITPSPLSSMLIMRSAANVPSYLFRKQAGIPRHMGDEREHPCEIVSSARPEVHVVSGVLKRTHYGRARYHMLRPQEARMRVFSSIEIHHYAVNGYDFKGAPLPLLVHRGNAFSFMPIENKCSARASHAAPKIHDSMLFRRWSRVSTSLLSRDESASSTDQLTSPPVHASRFGFAACIGTAVPRIESN